MTRAPATLLAVRQLLLTHLNVDPDTTRSADLEPAEVGIVGDPDHRGGYHCGSDRVTSNDYSVAESPRDRAGLADFACALDVGQFKVTTAKGTFDLPHYSRWLVAQCAANTADTRDIREVIYSPDGKTVKRWDRLGRRSSGDGSHLWHTHESFFRDAIKAGHDQRPVVIRYFKYIGILEDDDMSEQAEKEIHSVFTGMFNGGSSMGRSVDPDGAGKGTAGNSVVAKLDYTMLRLDQVAAQLTALTGRDFTDESAIVQGVLAGLDAEKIAAAIPATMARQVADELTRRLAA